MITRGSRGFLRQAVPSGDAHAATYGGKPWRDALVPHDMVTENRTLSGLTESALVF